MNHISNFKRRAVRKAKKILRLWLPESLLPEKAAEGGGFAIDTMEDVLVAVRRSLPTEKELKMVEIIVLKYKTPEVEKECAKHVIENTDWPFKLIFYDNRPGTKNMSKIWNKLVRESTCDYILILDSDAYVPRLSPCWLTRMMEVLESPDNFVVVPKVSKTSADEQRGEAENGPPRELKSEFAAQCVLYKKEIFEKVGYFDEDFLFYGQDSEWCLRLMGKGYKVYLRPDVSVFHLKHYSLNKANESKELNRSTEGEYADRIFKEKTQQYRC